MFGLSFSTAARIAPSVSKLAGGGKPKRTVPVTPAPARLVRSAARSSAARASGASSMSALPAAVSLTSRLVRTNSSVPRVRSSLRIWLLSDGWEMCKLAAAWPKCSSSATARKYRSRRGSRSIAEA